MPGMPTSSRALFDFRVNKVLDLRATIVFNRVQRFYQTFNIIATLLGSLSLAVLTFDEFHDGNESNRLLDASAGLLTSSALTAVVAVMIAIMLMFMFEGCEKPRRKDLAIAWIPLVLVDFVIVEFLFGVVFWYSARYGTWRAVLMSSQFAALLIGAIVVAVWMWNSMSVEGGLGGEETAQKALEHPIKK